MEKTTTNVVPLNCTVIHNEYPVFHFKLDYKNIDSLVVDQPESTKTCLWHT